MPPTQRVRQHSLLSRAASPSFDGPVIMDLIARSGGSTHAWAQRATMAAAAFLLASVAHADWFGTKTGPVRRLYVLVKANDDLGVHYQSGREERRWADLIVRGAVAKAREKYPGARVSGGFQVMQTEGSLFEPDPIVGSPMPTGDYHLLRIAVRTCMVSAWFKEDDGFCWEAALHRFSPNQVLGKKKGEVQGGIEAVMAGVSGFMADFRE
jgi:hypothetical protein